MSTKTLTIARALREVKKLKGEIATLTQRLVGSSTWLETRKPDFEFGATLTERDAKVARLVALKAAIGRANSAAKVEHRGVSLSLAESILRLDELKGRKSLFAGLQLRRETERQHTGDYDANGRPVYEVVAWQSVWSEPERAQKLEEIQTEIDELNEALEECNHRTPVDVS